MNIRTIKKVLSPTLHNGFLGEGHLAAALIDGTHFSETDPFILLMDDRLDLPGDKSAGGPHPHAGFETVTLVLDGDSKDWNTGTLELMTAGKGIIHTEEIKTKTTMRILQLWLVLPPEKRWIEPFHQRLQLEDVPTQKTDKSEIRVYSGTSNGVTSPLKNQTPFTLVDVVLQANSGITQVMPATYNAFIYVIDGTVWVGDRKVEKDQIAWFDKSGSQKESEITLSSGERRSRFVLYGGEPQHAPIVSHGPFIGDTDDDIRRLYNEYRQGKMPHLSDLAAERKVQYRAKIES
jgi:quercetin 2,3-dioxygenase